MKKILLSIVVLLSFVGYSIHEKNEQNETKVTPPIPDPSLSPGVTGITATSNTSDTSEPSAASLESGQYKNGEYIGSVEDAYYGNLQVKAVINNGKIADIEFLQYPNDRRTSTMINEQAIPFLKQEAIANQSSDVDIVSGATESSNAFMLSLASALKKAR